MKSKLDAGSFCLCLTLLFSWVCTAVAQQQEVRFRHIANRDGLSQNTIATILQDQKGYIWVGSWSGLARYDGTNFTAFRQSDTVANSISHNRINRIYEDKKGCLWVATGGGLNLFDRKTESFKRIGLTPGKGGANFISALQEDSFGNFWVSTYKGLKIYNPANQQLKSVRAWDNAKGREFYEGISFSLLEDREKKIWVGAKKGLRRFDPKSQKILPLPKTLSQNTALSSARIVVIRLKISVLGM
jgi:ligand-binding sensor domain-containing protein